MRLYEEASKAAFEIFSGYTPYVEAVSIDEAFLDITGSVHLYGTPDALGENLRREIRRRLGLTCSVGIAPNRLLAKIGSEECKPDGLKMMPFDPASAQEFLAPKKISVLWGVGGKTQSLLEPYGIRTCRDIQLLDAGRLAAILGSANAAETLKAYARGESSGTVNWQKPEDLSVSREYTFDVDETDRGRIRSKLLELASEVGRRLRTEERWARTARIKLRDGNFKTITRQEAFAAPARDDFTLRAKAAELFDRESTGSIRLIGFGVANLQRTDGGDETLFPDPAAEKRRKLERLSETIDRLHERGLAAGGPDQWRKLR
jgi:DNA polymerase-4